MKELLNFYVKVCSECESFLPKQVKNKNLQKMSRVTLANPLPPLPPCDVW